MTSRADQLRAKADRLRAKQEAAAPAARPSASAATVPAAVRARPVRTTVDLAPALHAGLVSWCAEAAVQLGRPRVHGQEVMRALVGLLLKDAEVSAAVQAELRRPS